MFKFFKRSKPSEDEGVLAKLLAELADQKIQISTLKSDIGKISANVIGLTQRFDTDLHNAYRHYDPIKDELSELRKTTAILLNKAGVTPGELRDGGLG